MTFLRFSSWFVPILMSMAACGRERDDSSSRVLHTWGEVVRGHAPSGKADCPTDGSGLASRLRNLAETLAQSNPGIFINGLALSSFCFVVDTADTNASASSSADTKTVVFSSKLIATAQSDAQLSAVVAHELAHITLQHAGAGEVSPRVLKTETGEAMNAQLRALQEDIKRLVHAGAPVSEIFAVSARYGEILSKLNELTDRIYGEENAHYNWLEQEADEVGAEFYVRAGYGISDFADMLWASHGQSSRDVTECKVLIQGALEGSSVRPHRGTASHPTPCWRAFHLLVDEFGSHGAHSDWL
jgi:hypothetical protein